MKTICIDYGHGGIINNVYQTAGKRYTFEKEKKQVFEGVINRQLSANIINYCIKYNIKVFDVCMNKYHDKVVLWTDLEQKDISLEQRVKNANNISNSIYISIHGNAIGNSSVGPSLNARGFCLFTSEGNTGSDIVASKIYSEVEKLNIYKMRKDSSDGDADYEENFYVLKNTKSPAVLIEAGFFTNIDDVFLMLSPQHQDKIALAILKGCEVVK